MPAPTPITDAERRAILAHHANGLSARAIARETGRSFTACARIVREAGLATDTTQTAEATATRVRRARAAKLDRAEALMAEAEELRRGMWDPVAEVVNTPSGPMWLEREPTARELKTQIDAIVRLVDTVDKLLAHFPDDQNTDDKSLMSNLMGELATFRATLDDPPAADDGA